MRTGRDPRLNPRLGKRGELWAEQSLVGRHAGQQNNREGRGHGLR